MKKAIIILCGLFVTALSFGQTSSGTWNSTTATYANTKHGITWELISELDWVGRPILTESTLLKVRNDDTRILVKLLANPYSGKEGDAWSMISMYESKDYTDVVKAEAKRNGMTYTGTKVVKSQLCGIHAVKVKSDMTKYYPEHKATVHSIEYTYVLCKNNNVYTVAITLLSALETDLDDYDRIVTRLFNGFKIK